MRQLGVKSGTVMIALVLASACSSAEPVAPSGTTPAAPATAAEPPAAAIAAAQPPEPGDPQVATPPGGATATLIYNDSTKTIESAVGSRFVIALPANIATPMRWRVQPAPTDSVLSAPAEAYHDAPPSDCAGCTGYPGTRTLTFEALTPGKTTLHLVYGSLTDANAKPERELTFEVLVK